MCPAGLPSSRTGVAAGVEADALGMGVRAHIAGDLATL